MEIGIDSFAAAAVGNNSAEDSKNALAQLLERIEQGLFGRKPFLFAECY